MKKNLIIVLTLLLAQSNYGQNAFRTACDGNLVRLDSILSTKTIDIKDNRGRSLLHWAVACKKKSILDYLIQRGIKVSEPDNQKKTALHVAIQFNNEEYFDYLMNLQPDDCWISVDGASLLELAILNKNVVLTKRLINKGVNVNIKNDRGSTPLEISRRVGAKEISEFLIAAGANKNLVREFNPAGKYMGLEAPDTIPKMFAPNFISTEEQEFGSVFNKEGNEFYFGVDVGATNEIRYTRIKDGIWSKPKVLLSHKRYNYNDPFLSNDENRLYFISNRALDGKGESKDVDIWYVQKTQGVWSEPINAGLNINTSGDEFYISFTNSGSMYFASNGHNQRDSTRTDHDIYYSRNANNRFQKPVSLSAGINTVGYEADVFVAPDESYLIFCSIRDDGHGRGDLYISFKRPDGSWTSAINMGNNINTKYYEYCPFVTKDGRYLFYTSNQDIYWVNTDIINDLKEKIR